MPKISLVLHTAPYWLEILPGVSLLVEPLRRSTLREVYDEVFGANGDADGDADADDGQAAGTTVTRARIEQQTLCLAQRVVSDWTGIGDADGNPIPTTPGTIEAVMDDPRVFHAFRTKYELPGLQVADEGNG